MAKINKYSGLIMLIFNIVVVGGGFFIVLGRSDQRIKGNEERIRNNAEFILRCDKKLEKLDDITRRLEIAIAKLETRTK